MIIFLRVPQENDHDGWCFRVSAVTVQGTSSLPFALCSSSLSASSSSMSSESFFLRFSPSLLSLAIPYNTMVATRSHSHRQGSYESNQVPRILVLRNMCKKLAFRAGE